MTKFPEVDISLLSLGGLSLYETLFRIYNVNKQKMEINQPNFLVLTFNLSGLEELWEIAFKAQNQEVV